MITSLSLFKLGYENPNKPNVKVKVNGRPTEALFDTGADSSILSWEWFRKQKFGVKLRKDGRSLCTASGEDLKIIGIMDSKVEIAGKIISAEFLVVKGITTKCIIGANTMAREKNNYRRSNKKCNYARIKG